MPDTKVYYNDSDAYVCRWLNNLVEAGLLPQGDVDDRPIQLVQPADLAGYIQCHFFAGIGGWPLALQIAGWYADQPVWTGSCPCQPFSVAGQRRGSSDERHLWPEFHRLIRECSPPTVFGEQVASKAGREWLSGVFTDLESVGYAVAGADLCAASAGAPHIRQRLYWVANAYSARSVHSIERPSSPQCNWSRATDMASGSSYGISKGEPTRFKDGTCRRTKPGVAMLVDAVPGRMEPCAAFGNAIVPQVAAEFIKAVMDCVEPRKTSQKPLDLANNSR